MAVGWLWPAPGLQVADNPDQTLVTYSAVAHTG